ncbi:hypothetical protein BDZ91DRAFT_708913 [Kalaharituber pfeilii]|nr:hypothetical protein BDZ91DRAFT_708913 [Kalaharituber pfeilii]
MRYTKGIVDESPLSRLGSERGLGVGYLEKSETTGISRISRRFSSSAGSVWMEESEFRDGIKDGIKDWVKKPTNGGKKKVSFSGIWKCGRTSFCLIATTSSGQKLAKTLKLKQKSAHLSDSTMAQSGSKQMSTESLSWYSTCSSYSDKQAEFRISDDHRLAQEEWEEFLMLNVQKCMCKRDWMARTMRHLWGREGMGSKG